MIRITLELEQIDYDALLERYLPQAQEALRASGNPLGMLLSNGMSASMAAGILRKLPESTKDQLAAELINASAGKLTEKAEQAAVQLGVGGKVRAIHAEAGT